MCVCSSLVKYFIVIRRATCFSALIYFWFHSLLVRRIVTKEKSKQINVWDQKRLIFLCRQGLFRKVSRSQQSDKPRCLERFHTPPLYPKNCHPVFCKSLEDCVKCKLYLSGCSWQGATTVTKIKQILLHIYIIYVEVLIWGFIEIHFFMLQLFYRAKMWLSCFLIFWYQISHILINCITFIAGSCFSNDHVSCLFSVFCPSIVILRTAIWESL